MCTRTTAASLQTQVSASEVDGSEHKDPSGCSQSDDKKKIKKIFCMAN